MTTLTKTAEVAIAFTDKANRTGADMVAAWAIHLADVSIGWTAGHALKGGRKAALKQARERHGYVRDDSGEVVLKDNGNRKPRSAVMDALRLADNLLAYMVKHEQAWLETMHKTVVDADKSEAIAEQIVQMTDYIVGQAGGATKEAIKDWIDPKPVEKQPVAESATEALKTSEPETVAFDFETVYQVLASHADQITIDQAQRLMTLATDIATTNTPIAEAA